MNPSTPGLPLHQQLPESAQIHVHQVGDAIQPSHPLPCPPSPALNLSQHQGLFKWVKIAGRNINNLRYADDTTLMAESEEELKSLSMKVKEESEKVYLKLNIQITKIMASGPITSWQIDGETVETGWLYFGGLQNHCRWWLQPWN